MERLVVYSVMLFTLACCATVHIEPPEEVSIEIGDTHQETLINSLFGNLPRIVWNF